MLPLWIIVIVLLLLVMVALCSRSASAYVVIIVLVVLLYMEIRDKSGVVLYVLVILLLGILRLFMIYRFAESLAWWYAKVSASPSLSSTHFGLEHL